jgi:hypothetical protein
LVDLAVTIIFARFIDLALDLLKVLSGPVLLELKFKTVQVQVHVLRHRYVVNFGGLTRVKTLQLQKFVAT